MQTEQLHNNQATHPLQSSKGTLTLLPLMAADSHHMPCFYHSCDSWRHNVRLSVSRALTQTASQAHPKRLGSCSLARTQGQGSPFPKNYRIGLPLMSVDWVIQLLNGRSGSVVAGSGPDS